MQLDIEALVDDGQAPVAYHKAVCSRPVGVIDDAAYVMRVVCIDNVTPSVLPWMFVAVRRARMDKRDIKTDVPLMNSRRDLDLDSEFHAWLCTN